MTNFCPLLCRNLTYVRLIVISTKLVDELCSNDLLWNDKNYN